MVSGPLHHSPFCQPFHLDHAPDFDHSRSTSPGTSGFDPLGLKPSDPAGFKIMQAKDLQNGRLAMLAAAGFMAQELVDGKGIVEHFLG